MCKITPRVTLQKECAQFSRNKFGSFRDSDTSMVTSTMDDLSIVNETSALQSEAMSNDKIILEKLQQIKRAKLIAKAREKKSDLKALKHEN